MTDLVELNAVCFIMECEECQGRADLSFDRIEPLQTNKQIVCFESIDVGLILDANIKFHFASHSQFKWLGLYANSFGLTWRRFAISIV